MKKLLQKILSNSKTVSLDQESHVIVSADDALKLLKEGNERFSQMNFERPNISKERLIALDKNGQNPFAIIVSCSDSRVPLAHVFDRGLGDLFEIKNVGNVIDQHVIGSVEYPLSCLDVKLVVVLGHSNCGFINTALTRPKGASEFFKSLIKSIEPAIRLARRQNGCSWFNVTKNNAILNAKALVKRDKVIRNHVQKNGVVIVPAYYSGASGKVEFYTENKISSESIR